MEEEIISPDECFKAYVEAGCTPGTYSLEFIKETLARGNGMTRTQLGILIDTHLPVSKLRERGVHISASSM